MYKHQLHFILKKFRILLNQDKLLGNAMIARRSQSVMQRLCSSQMNIQLLPFERYARCYIDEK